jgi:hypothetical protein
MQGRKVAKGRRLKKVRAVLPVEPRRSGGLKPNPFRKGDGLGKPGHK